MAYLRDRSHSNRREASFHAVVWWCQKVPPGGGGKEVPPQIWDREIDREIARPHHNRRTCLASAACNGGVQWRRAMAMCNGARNAGLEPKPSAHMRKYTRKGVPISAAQIGLICDAQKQAAAEARREPVMGRRKPRGRGRGGVVHSYRARTFKRPRTEAVVGTGAMPGSYEQA
eukprot:7389345-Prymnesium_polylepis.1